MRARLSVSIDSEVAKMLERASAGASRSMVVERALVHELGGIDSAIILAGGPPEGLYMGELKVYRPLVKVAGRTVFEIMVGKLVKAGVRRVVVVGSREVNSAIFSQVGSSGVAGATVEFVEEKEHKGSMWTLAMGMRHLGSSKFAFCACDHFIDFPILPIRESFESSNSPITLGVYAGTAFDWSTTSVIEMQGSKISRYCEKPSKASTRLVSTLVGFAKASAFDGMKMSGSIENAFEELSRKGALDGFIVKGDFVNINSRKEYLVAQRIAGREGVLE